MSRNKLYGHPLRGLRETNSHEAATVRSMYEAMSKLSKVNQLYLLQCCDTHIKE